MSYLLTSLRPADISAFHEMSSMTLANVSGLRKAENEFQELEAEYLSLALPEGLNAAEFEEPRKETPLTSRSRILLCISAGAVWGVLARLALTALTEYDGSFLGGVIWANFTACFVMGIAVSSENVWQKLTDDVYQDAAFTSKGIIPFYVGITTGFCGTCLSFSSMILEAFNKAANTLPVHEDYPNASYGIMEAISVTLAHLSLSVAGFHAGKHLTDMLDNFQIPRHLYNVIELVWITSGISSYIVAVVLIPTKPSSQWRFWTLLSLIAPWGAMLRYYILKRLNGVIKNFPLGTFTVNLTGSILLAIFTILSRGKNPQSLASPIVENLHGCQVIVGLEDGFCGTFTTVSTFVVEIFGMRSSHGYVYGAILIGTAFATTLLILGSYNWTVGLTHTVCS